MSMFFDARNANLFRPLTGKFREMAVGCLKTLYERLYGPNADYQALITRAELKELFLPVINSTPVLTADNEDEYLDTVKSEDARVNWMIRELEETGWIEHSPDKGTAKSVYRLTRTGKAFTEVFTNQDTHGLISRQRNVRNTRNAIKTFLSDRDPYNLMDAYAYAQKVNMDLSDEITELHERKREVMRQAAAQAASAMEHFRDYMDKHFMPDISVRLAIDSVDRYHSEIRGIIDQIRAWSPERREAAEAALAQRAPQFAEQAKGSAIEHALINIEGYLSSACASKMPELRSALTGFIRRIEIISRQVALLANHEEGSISQFTHRLANAAPEDQEQALDALSSRLSPTAPRLLDPGSIRLPKQSIPTEIPEEQEVFEPTWEERRQAAIEHALQSAFTLSEDEIYENALAQLGESASLHLRYFDFNDALSLMRMSRAFEVGSLSHSTRKPRLIVEPVLDAQGHPERFSTPLGEFDDFLIKKDFTHE